MILVGRDEKHTRKVRRMRTVKASHASMMQSSIPNLFHSDQA